jgi:hypothetical protein
MAVHIDLYVLVYSVPNARFIKVLTILMRPWIAVAYSAPVAAATAVFIIYPSLEGIIL